MKKHILLLTLGLTAALTLGAQDRNCLNHLSIGATAGTDAFGFQAAVPLGNHLAFRAGYVTSFNLGYQRTIRMDMDATWDDSDFSLHDDVSMRATMNVSDLRGIIEIYPGKKNGFHFALGAYYSLQDRGFLTVGNVTPLPIDPEEYGKSGISVDGHLITTDENGMVEVGLFVPKFRPYAGIGFGRPVRPNRRVTVTFDLGACWIGQPTLQATDHFGEQVVINSTAVQNLDGGWIDRIAYYAKVYPVLQLGLNVRLF